MGFMGIGDFYMQDPGILYYLAKLKLAQRHRGSKIIIGRGNQEKFLVTLLLRELLKKALSF